MQTFLSDGVPIAYVDLPPHASDAEPGRGEAILLIHGFASNHAFNWANTTWTTALARAGFRVVALDNRGHGRSGKLYEPAAYASTIMAGDALRLMDHLAIGRADVMGYSMGARITAYLASMHPERVRSALLGGLGIKLVDGVGLPVSIADGMEAGSIGAVTDPVARGFRSFAEQTGSDLKALAACIRGSRQTMTREECAAMRVPVLVSVGTLDDIAGDPHALAGLIPGAVALAVEGRDHMSAVGDRAHKAGVLDFLARRP